MFGKIKFIADNTAHVETVSSAEELGDLMNIHVVFEAPDQLILGEVEEVNDQVIKIRFLGEFHDGRYVSGVIRKPVLSSKIRMINDQELKAIVGEYNSTTFKLGRSSIYKDYDVCVDINNLFGENMASLKDANEAQGIESDVRESGGEVVHIVLREDRLFLINQLVKHQCFLHFLSFGAIPRLNYGFCVRDPTPLSGPEGHRDSDRPTVIGTQPYASPPFMLSTTHWRQTEQVQ